MAASYRISYVVAVLVRDLLGDRSEALNPEVPGSICGMSD